MSEADTDAAGGPDREESESGSDGVDTTEAAAEPDDERTESTSRPRREVAVRILAAEYDEATLSYAESDEERAPTYVVTPTGARANRVFVVGVLTDVERVSGDVVRARIADPTGTFVVYAGQYQPDARGTFEETEPPEFVALTGKARTFSPDDADQVYASIRPETVAIVDAETRDRWAIRTAERTIERIDTMADVLATIDDSGAARDLPGLRPSVAAGIPRARDHYGTTPAYLRSLRTCAREVAELVAGARDAIDPPERKPDDGNGTFEDLPADHSLFDRSDAVSATAETADDRDPTATTGGSAGASSTPASGSTTETPADRGDTEPDGESGETDDGSASTDRDETGSGAADPDGDVEPESGGDSVSEVGEPATEGSPLDVDEDSSEGSLGGMDEDSAEASLSDGDDGAGDDAGQPEETDDDGGTAAASEPTSTTDPDTSAAGDESLDDPLDPAEREQVEAEFGAEFESGAEVDGPGEAGIEPPEPDDEVAGGGSRSGEGNAEGAPPAGDPDGVDGESGGSGTESADTEPDLSDAVMESMRELDDGDGADRATVIERTAEATGADESVIEEAVTEALMDGRCYEPDDTTLKPI